MRARFGWLLCGVFLVGCGAARAPSAASPGAAGSASQAEADFDAALAELDRGLGNPPTSLAMTTGQPARRSAEGGGDEEAPSGAAGAAPPPAPPAAAPPADAAAQQPVPAEPPATAASEGDVCVDVCRALGSLVRAADAICRIAGETDERCTRARGIVSDRTGQAARCSCKR